MCGIVAYLGDKEAQPLLLEGLRRLEYRGYDSSGIAVLNGKGLEIMKEVGRIQKLENGLSEPSAARQPGHLATRAGRRTASRRT